ncbi:hypothetical protein ACUN24_20560 [Pedobacter sp. WC2501]|uniref:hypothetical protein n=1 Tax=Pedobacter sp. WC2501 TaxID=3461400 RepID=UPI004045246B
MSLAIDYCKEIATQLRQNAVYMPGSSVKPGDIIKFDYRNIFGVPKPFGEFSIYGNLSDLGVVLETEHEPVDSLDSYVYASKGAVSVSFEADLTQGSVGKGNLTIGFSKVGSTYLSAIDCREQRFKSIIGLEAKLVPHQGTLEWSDYFVVVSVTTAARALIMQSNSKTASLEVGGKVNGLVPAGQVVRDIDASLDLKISRYKEASFIKDWSSNVPVFFALVRFRKKFSKYREFSATKGTALSLDLSKDTSEKNPFVIEVVDPLDIL